MRQWITTSTSPGHIIPSLAATAKPPTDAVDLPFLLTGGIIFWRSCSKLQEAVSLTWPLVTVAPQGHAGPGVPREIAGYGPSVCQEKGE